LGEQCSLSERRADEATRDVVSWLKCEFMKDRVGETFIGVITAVTGFGLFVELKDIYVEGLVHVTALPGDYYHFDPVHHRLAGERTGRSFRLGDSVDVRVMRVDLDERKIDFEMAQSALDAPIGRKGRDLAAVPRARTAKGGAAKADLSFANTDVKRSREVKQSLQGEAKGAGRAKSAGSASPKSADKAGKPGSHRKGPAKSGAARKPKAKP
jgi:ribonuclease R